MKNDTEETAVDGQPHRMLTHRTLRMNKFVEHLLVFFAIFNGSGAPASWVAYQRLHHARADTPEDISSPKQGAFGGDTSAGSTSRLLPIGIGAARS